MKNKQTCYIGVRAGGLCAFVRREFIRRTTNRWPLTASILHTILCLVLIGLCAVVGSVLQAQTRFLRSERQQDTYGFRLGNQSFANVGANLPDLFELFLHREYARADKILTEAQAVGIRFARCFGSTWGPQEFHLFEDNRERWLDAYDRMLAAADRHGIAVVPSLLFNVNMLPDYVRSKNGSDERIVDFLTPGSPSNRMAVEYVTVIVSRYKNDPRILFWEIGNEYNLEADLSAQWKMRPANQIPTSTQIRAFLIQMAALIKKLDKNHLVTSGNGDMRPYAWHIRQAMLAHQNKSNPTDWTMDWRKDTFEQYKEMLRFFNPPPLDIISVHHYPLGKETPGWMPEDDTKAAMLTWTRNASDQIGKPLFVGEFGQTVFDEGKEQPSPWLRDFLKRMQTGDAPLAAVWTWEYHSDDPGQTRLALTPENTPALARLLAETNRALKEKSHHQDTKTPDTSIRR